jgi:hypothetical protein
LQNVSKQAQRFVGPEVAVGLFEVSMTTQRPASQDIDPASNADDAGRPSPGKSTPSPQADGTPESLHKTEQPGPQNPASHAASAPGDEHMGATEQQVSKTMPPSPDDDEPKQG